nr:transposase [Propionivibrio dicarboxylicus]
MSSKRCTDEFKVEAIEQITEDEHPVAEVAGRQDAALHRLYQWPKEYDQPAEAGQHQNYDQFVKMERALQPHLPPRWSVMALNHLRRQSALWKYNSIWPGVMLSSTLKLGRPMFS